MTTGNMTPDRAFMLLLDPDAEKAAEKYALLIHQLTRFFEWRDCTDPEALAAETLTRGLSKVAGGATIFAEQPAAYFYGIAKNVLHEERRAQLRNPGELVDAASSPTWRGLNATEARICLKQCLARLSPDDRALVRGYYEGDRKTLSGRLGLSGNALRVRVHRIKQRLNRMLELDLKRNVGNE